MTVPVAAEEGSYVRFALAGSTVHTATASGGTQETSFELPDGRHTIGVTATDASGNASETAEFNVTVDTTAPDAPAVKVDTDTKPGGHTAIRVAGERDSDYQVRVRGPDKYTENGTLSAKGKAQMAWQLPNGDYTLKALLTDADGNTSTTRKKIFSVDLPEPDHPHLEITSDAGAAPVEMAVSSEGAESVTVSMHSASTSRDETIRLASDGDGTGTLDVPDGRYSVEAIAVDFQGQRSRSVREEDLVVDTMPPTVALTKVDELLAAGLFAYQLQAEEGSVVHIASDTEALTAEFTADGKRQDFEIDVPHGEHLITVTAVDAFGNETVRRLGATVARPFGLLDWTIVAGLLAMLAAAWLRRRTIIRWTRRRLRGSQHDPGGLALPPPT